MSLDEKEINDVSHCVVRLQLMKQELFFKMKETMRLVFHRCPCQ